jgi:hypothetical protein
MSNPFTTVPLIREHFEQFTAPNRIVVVRVFEFPHFWYAGVVRTCEANGFDEANISLHTSIRFERDGEYNAWHPGNSLVRISTDKWILGTKDSILEFKLKEACVIVHSLFQEDSGIIGLQYEKGFAHISYRGADMVSIKKMLEMHGGMK